MMEVEVYNRKTIVPSSPTPPDLRNYKLSSMDQLPMPSYVPIIYYYSASNNHDGTVNTETRCKQLERSISETLTLYYPFAGRYIKEKQMVDCGDQGIEYLEARVKGTLSQLLNGEVDMSSRNHLVPIILEWKKSPSGYDMISTNMFESDTTPILAVQVNTFDCGGLAIGICVTHRIVDGFTVTNFVNNWANVCLKGGIDQVQPPKFDVGTMYPARDYMPTLKPWVQPKRGNVTRSFVFDEASITRLKSMTRDSEGLVKATRVVLVTALTWKVLIKMKQSKASQRIRDSILSHALNLRGRVSMPAENSSGNLSTITFSRYEASNHDGSSEKDLFLRLVGQVDDMFKTTKEEYKRLDSEGLFFNILDVMTKLSEESNKGEVDVFMCSSWCRFPIYEADFGWGKPAWFSAVDVYIEHSLMVDTKDGFGIEAWICLDENDMLHFEKDPEIISFTSHVKG